MDGILIVCIAIMAVALWSFYSYGKSLEIRADEKLNVIRPVDRSGPRLVIQPVSKSEVISIVKRIEANREKDLHEKTEQLIQKWDARKHERNK